MPAPKEGRHRRRRPALFGGGVTLFDVLALRFEVRLELLDDIDALRGDIGLVVGAGIVAEVVVAFDLVEDLFVFALGKGVEPGLELLEIVDGKIA